MNSPLHIMEDCDPICEEKSVVEDRGFLQNLQVADRKSTDFQVEDKNHLQSPIWFARQDPQNKTDGVLYIPFDNSKFVAEGEVCQKNICWYFVMDASYSMDTTVLNKEFSRWYVAVQLLNQALSDLQALNRGADRVTIVTFSGETQVIVDALPIQDYHPKLLEHIKPKGSTDISLANSCTYALMLKNPLLARPDYLAVEIFFTDGEPTHGLTESESLKQQKAGLYNNLTKTVQAQHPFLWCGGISSDADVRVIRALAQASPHNLWVYIKDEQTENFAAEIGGLITMLTSMKVLQIPVTKKLAPVETLEHKSVMLLPDVPNLFYFKSKPAFITLHPTRVIKAEHFVSIYKITEILYQMSDKLTTYDIKDLGQRAQARQVDDTVSNTEWENVFYKTRANLLQNLELLQNDKHNNTIQISPHRNAYLSSDSVHQSSQRYQTTYSQFS